jgi:DNA ligase-1
VRYQIVVEAYRDLEGATGRLAMIDRLAGLFTQTPTELLPTVALLCQGEIAPDFAGVELGLAERLAARAVAQPPACPASGPWPGCATPATSV